MKGENCLFVVSGASGTGKDTMVAQLLKNHPEIQHTVSATTRPMRAGEANGVNYHYVSVEDFKALLENDGIVEHTCYCGNYYGTLRSEIEKRMAAGVPVILVIEVEGAANIKRMYPDSTTVFVLPPNMEVLEQRLRGRGTEEDEVIASRLQRAKDEIALAATYDERVINDNLEESSEALYRIIQAKLNR